MKLLGDRRSILQKSHQHDVKACLSDLRNKYDFVPADKAQNNVIIICKSITSGL